MSFLRRLLHWERPNPAADADASDLDSAPAGISFRDLVRQVDAVDAGARAEAALLLSALGQPAAIQPMVRAWVRHGDPAMADALGTFGSRVTPVAARAVRDLSLSASQRARAIQLLGRLADPASRAALRAAAVDPDPVVHIAADVAMVEVDDPMGADHLTRGLAVRPPAWRAAALRALRGSDHPAALALAEDHIARYLAEGRAVPGDVDVALPLLIDTEGDLARRIGRYVAQAREPFVLVTGPGTADLAESQR
jgi:HEAT repeat protein